MLVEAARVESLKKEGKNEFFTNVLKEIEREREEERRKIKSIEGDEEGGRERKFNYVKY